MLDCLQARIVPPLSRRLLAGNPSPRPRDPAGDAWSVPILLTGYRPPCFAAPIRSALPFVGAPAKAPEAVSARSSDGTTRNRTRTPPYTQLELNADGLRTRERPVGAPCQPPATDHHLLGPGKFGSRCRDCVPSRAGVPPVWVSSSDSNSGKARISPHPVTSLYNLSPGVAMTPVDDVLAVSEVGVFKVGWTSELSRKPEHLCKSFGVD